jgi:MoxR-like ATPase
VRCSDANRPTEDPRAFLRRHGPGALAARLGEHGYRIQETPLLALVESLDSGTPLLLEGNRGSGKSSMAVALTDAFNLVKFHVQCNRGLTVEEILYSWDRAGQEHAEKAERWSRDYLVLGEALAAFDWAERHEVPPLVQLDEFDKLLEMHQDMFLGLFEDGFHDVPRLTPTSRVGVTTPGRPWPVILVTSNNRAADRDQAITAPFRSRCSYAWIPDPTPYEEVAIMRVRAPEASPELFRCVVKLLDAIRSESTIYDKPSIRETVRLIKRLSHKRVETITEDVIKQHACHIAKQRDDALNLINAAEFLAVCSARPYPLVDEMVDRALAEHDEIAGVFA